MSEVKQILSVYGGVVDGVVNVRDFGADGSDTEDDSAAFQAAIDANAGPIYLPHGKYRVGTTLTVSRPSVILFGLGDHNSRGSRPVEIKYTGKDTLLRLSGETSGFRMEGLFLTGPSRSSKAQAITIASADKFQSGYTFERVGIIQFGTAVTIEKPEPIKNRWIGKLLFNNCNLHYNGQAIVCNTAGITNLDILQSEIRQCLGEQPVIDVMGERLSIVGCNLEGQPQVIQVSDSHTLFVEQCYFEGNSEYWLSATRVQGLQFRNNYLRPLTGETYTEPVKLRECMNVVVEWPNVNRGGWKIP